MSEASYTKVRRTIWFREIGVGQPGDFVNAKYVGRDHNNNVDPLGEGEIDKVYKVILFAKTVGAIIAPCPDFCNDEENIQLPPEDQKILDEAIAKGPISFIEPEIAADESEISLSQGLNHAFPPHDLKNLFLEMNRTNLNAAVRYHVNKETKKFRVKDDTVQIKRDISALNENSRLPELYYDALANYFEEDKNTPDIIVKALAKGPGSNVKAHLTKMLQELKPFNKKLILASEKIHNAEDFSQIEKDFPDEVDVIIVKSLVFNDLLNYFKNYDQILIFAHGAENFSFIGDFELTLNQLKLLIAKAGPDRPNVLGVFSCQDEWGAGIIDILDYFITDGFSSEKFSKIFAYRYIQFYQKYHCVERTFDTSVIGTMFRAVSDPDFQLFRLGDRIR